MDESNSEAFVNRGDPIPVINFNPSDQAPPIDENSRPADSPEKRRGLRQGLMDKFQRTASGNGKASEGGSSIQDRLLEKVLQQVIPVEGPDPSDSEPSNSVRSYTERPNFNITTMSTNFRRFNSRIGVVFVFQARMIRLLSWKTPSHTLSFLAVYTFICLDPYLLTVLPLVVLLLAVLIPNFITRHPAPPTTVTTYQYSMSGPPIAPAPTVKPVKELSKDFFRNMRDLQNSMEDFSRLHDKVIATITPATNFSNEALSSTIFLFLFLTASTLFIASNHLPWRLLFLVGGWIFICGSHPYFQNLMLAAHKEHVEPHEEHAKSSLETWISHDILLDSAPETREVEIFELQKLSGGGEWEAWLFSSSPYDPMSPARIAEDRPKGTRFFEDVLPPRGWEWSEKKWALDLWSREWVEERIITGVEVETEGERWVYDIEYEKVQAEMEMPGQKKSKKGKMMSWEESTGGFGRRGDWRRRRWVRMVKRKDLSRLIEGK